MAATIQTIEKPTRARGLDTSGNNNHAQIYSGRALEFDGVTDHLDIGSNISISTSAWTVTVWVYMHNYPSSNNMVICSNTDSDADSAEYLGLGTTGHMNIWDNPNTTYRSSSTVIGKNIWKRLVYSYDGSGTITFYQNGVADGTGSLDSSDDKLAIKVIGSLHNQTRLFDGKMSDFQAWDAAFSADDAMYDYLNPEQLALNRSGTSLTNSNLKLWYPMNEGHRGNQSYVLDASNTGLGDEILTNTDMSLGDDGSWAGHNLDGGDTDIPIDETGETVYFTDAKSYSGGKSLYVSVNQSGDGVKNNSANSVAGVTYRMWARVWVVTGTVDMHPANAGFKDDTGVNSTTTGEWEELEVFATCDTSRNPNNWCITQLGSTDAEYYIDAISVKAVNNKNNATTVFYGDELITDTANREFSGSPNWTGYGSPSAAEVDGAKFSVETNGDGSEEGGQLAISHIDGVGGAHPIVAGRTYRVTADLDYVSGNADGVYKFVLGDTGVNVKASDGTPNDGTITSTEEEYYADITTTNNTGALRIDITAGTNDEETVFTIDNVSVKEIGTAMGWTDADKQLDIPQTALQSYNQLAWFDGVADYISIADHNDFSFDASSQTFSLSAWIFWNGNNGAIQSFFGKWGASAREWLFRINAGNKLEVILYDEDEDGYIGIRNSTSVVAGEWHHVVATATTGTTNASCKVYLNGENVGDTSSDSGTFVAMEQLSGVVSIGSDTPSTLRPFNGSVTEACIFDKTLSQAEVTELYNNGLALDATTHSASSDLIGYWRNNGAATWQDLTSNNRDGTPTSVTDTMLITAGVDGSRDSQGFLMNKKRTTNSLNFPMVLGGNDNKEYAVIPTASGTAPGDNLHFVGRPFSFTCWVKTHYITGAAQIIFDRGDGEDGYLLKVSALGKPVFVTEEDDTEISASAGTSSNGGLSSGVMTNDTWYFIAGTHEGLASSADQKLYVGTASVTPVLIVTQASGVGMETSAANLYIGQRFNGGLPYNGEIDDLCFYDNNQLTLAEITRNYNAGKRSHR